MGTLYSQRVTVDFPMASSSSVRSLITMGVGFSMKTSSQESYGDSDDELHDSGAHGVTSMLRCRCGERTAWGLRLWLACRPGGEGLVGSSQFVPGGYPRSLGCVRQAFSKNIRFLAGSSRETIVHTRSEGRDAWN